MMPSIAAFMIAMISRKKRTSTDGHLPQEGGTLMTDSATNSVTGDGDRTPRAYPIFRIYDSSKTVGVPEAYAMSRFTMGRSAMVVLMSSSPFPSW